MCLSPISIVNPNKYISLSHRDAYLLQVPCGKCAECMSANSNAWLYRSYYEFQDCIGRNPVNFILFDTLTYSDKYLPKMSDLVADLPNYPCFNHKHITDFFKRLRIALDRKYKGVKCRYFLSSEYGTNPTKTHRPHYHVLFYVYCDSGNISPCQFSRLVADCWQFGITDGLPYKSFRYVLEHNTIRSILPADLLRAANYVTKYVQKSCQFQKELDRRIKVAMVSICDRLQVDYDEYISSVHGRRVMSKLKRSVNQFHRQSLHYGESALQSMDLNNIFASGAVIMPHHKATMLPIPLPTYYKRKLFYDLVEFEGCKTWQLTDLGKQYKAARKIKLVKDLANRFECAKIQWKLDIDSSGLADYVYNQRGRIIADFPESTLFERLPFIEFFNYITPSDKEHIGSGVTRHYVGNNSIGYKAERIPPHYKPSQFIDKFVYLNPDYEEQLAIVYCKLSGINEGKQNAYELKQRLSNVFKSIYGS